MYICVCGHICVFRCVFECACIHVHSPAEGCAWLQMGGNQEGCATSSLAATDAGFVIAEDRPSMTAFRN